MFLDYFESQGHLVLKSFSLVPHNDNSLLLINAGMAPLKPYFTGQEIPPRRRVATCQKCIRTGDIENVGKTARHGTFFEMLGNFSFGDYFKHEAIHWTWEFLTKVIGLDPNRLYPTVFEEDDEAFEIWTKEIGLAPERIHRFDKSENFWEHGSGPCGPCSEVYYDRGEKYGKDEYVGSEGDRFMEVWNNVFTQFENDGQGHYTELKNKNIDTGMGLERLAVVVQDVDSIFEVDTIKALLDEVAGIAGTKYKEDEKKDVSLRLITDHIRSCTFMISDGIMPSNEGRGYVLRRLLRRAARHGRMLGIEGEFLAKLAQTVIELSKDGYPELEEKKEMILKVLTEEESKFDKTIDQGLAILSEMEEKMARDGVKVMSGEDAFKLYDTYGFPIDLTKEIMEEKGFSIDEEGFVAAMENQRETARKARKTTNYMGADVTVYQSLDPALTTVFTGYDSLKTEGKIMALTTDTEVVEALTDGQEGTIVTDKSPFYATMGGQNADVGVIFTDDAEFVVEDTIKLPGDKIGHIGHVTKGMFTMSDVVEMEVDAKNRENTAKNHSCTHLLHKALREILGNHVEQAGSLVDAHRLRFDFTHFQSLTGEEIRMVEDLVNQEIKAALPVVTEVMDVESAKKSGAMALFGEKYHGDVRVVSMGDFSKELCGGTHVKNTSEIGAFKIISESGIAAGVRRIEALTGDALNDYYRGLEEKLQTLAKQLKTNVSELGDRIDNLLEEVKALKSENEQLKSKLANEAMGNAAENIVDVKGVKLLAMKVEGVEMNELRNLGDQLKKDTDDGVVVLASQVDGKVNLMVMAGESAVKKGAHAGNIVKAIAGFVGGGGGGRPNMAQAGGKKPEGIDEALLAAKTTLDQQL
jgi:alanine--tRNA ligase